MRRKQQKIALPLQDKFDTNVTKGEDKEVFQEGLALVLSHLSHPTLFFTHCGNITGS